MRFLLPLLCSLVFLPGVRADDPKPDTPEEEVLSLKPRVVLDNGAHFAEISRVLFLKDGKLVSVGNGPLIRSWDAATGELLRTLRPNGHISRLGQSTALA